MRPAIVEESEGGADTRYTFATLPILSLKLIGEHAPGDKKSIPRPRKRGQSDTKQGGQNTNCTKLTGLRIELLLQPTASHQFKKCLVNFLNCMCCQIIKFSLEDD